VDEICATWRGAHRRLHVSVVVRACTIDGFHVVIVCILSFQDNRTTTALALESWISRNVADNFIIELGELRYEG
jgi:hypothetical protein